MDLFVFEFCFVYFFKLLSPFKLERNRSTVEYPAQFTAMNSCESSRWLIFEVGHELTVLHNFVPAILVPFSFLFH